MARPPEVQLSRGARPFWNNRYQRGFCRAPKEGFGEDLRRREKRGQGTRDPNTMEVDREWGGDQRCFNCKMFRHMAQNCRNQKKRLEEGCKRHQKIRETSEPLAGLPQ